MKCSDTKYNGSPWEWRTLGVAVPGSGGPWKWRPLGVADPGSGEPKPMLEVLYWLTDRQRIEYRVASLVWRCQLGIAPIYLTDLCRSVSGIASGRSLRSAGRGSSQSRLLITTLM